MDIGEASDRILRTDKRSQSTRGDDHNVAEERVSVSIGDEDTHNQEDGDEEEGEDYMKLTVQNLKHEMTKYDCGHLILNRGHYKKEILALYETHVLPKKALEKEEERKRQRGATSS